MYYQDRSVLPDAAYFGEADDKIIAVMKGDELYVQWSDVSDCPKSYINRLKHYFLTYKQHPGSNTQPCLIPEVYGAEEAKKVIELSIKDYKELVK